MTKVLMMALMLALLGACSIMDISMLETAVPLDDKVVEITLYEGLGVELGSMMKENDTDPDLEGGVVTGAKAGMIFFFFVYVCSVIYTSGYTVGGKLGAKILVGNTDIHYLALAPALTGLSSYDTEEGYPEYKALGAELAFLSSWEVEPGLIPTFALRISYDHLIREPNNVQLSESQNLIHGNLTGSLRLKIGPVILHPELGAEIAPFWGSNLVVFPTGALGLGLAF